jgi:hypothetical protein
LTFAACILFDLKVRGDNFTLSYSIRRVWSTKGWGVQKRLL